MRNWQRYNRSVVRRGTEAHLFRNSAGSPGVYLQICVWSFCVSLRRIEPWCCGLWEHTKAENPFKVKAIGFLSDATVFSMFESYLLKRSDGVAAFRCVLVVKKRAKKLTTTHELYSQAENKVSLHRALNPHIKQTLHRLYCILCPV